MATLASVATALDAKLISVLSVTATFNDRLRRRHVLTSGQTHAAITVISIGKDTDSNVSREIGAFLITVIHYLASITDEAAYTEGDMITDQKELSDPSWYRAIAGVYGIDGAPEIEEPERPDNGNVIEYNVAARLVISP